VPFILFWWSFFNHAFLWSEWAFPSFKKNYEINGGGRDINGKW
jgi:hypothetical protein